MFISNTMVWDNINYKNVDFLLSTKKIISDYIIISIAIIIGASAYYFFLFPKGIILGGLSGIAAIVNNTFPSLNIGLVMTILNFLLIILSFFTIGNDFGFKTIYGSFFLSFVFWKFEYIVPLNKINIIDNVYLSLLIGIMISSISMTLIFIKNSSTGGTDIGAKILNKKTGIEMGTTLFLCDILIVFMAAISFGPFIGLLSILGKALMSFIMNLFIGMYRNKKRKSTKIVNDFVIRKIL
ncbi:MAG: YitT family protein [Clostridiales bacterium]